MESDETQPKKLSDLMKMTPVGTGKDFSPLFTETQLRNAYGRILGDKADPNASIDKMRRTLADNYEEEEGWFDVAAETLLNKRQMDWTDGDWATVIGLATKEWKERLRSARKAVQFDKQIKKDVEERNRPMSKEEFVKAAMKKPPSGLRSVINFFGPPIADKIADSIDTAKFETRVAAKGATRKLSDLAQKARPVKPK